jgi:hypothetical protein
MTNADRMQILINRHDLALSDVAAMTSSSLHTVRSWLKPERVKSYRAMPDHRLRLLEYEIAQRHQPGR